MMLLVQTILPQQQKHGQRLQCSLVVHGGTVGIKQIKSEQNVDQIQSSIVCNKYFFLIHHKENLSGMDHPSWMQIDE